MSCCMAWDTESRRWRHGWLGPAQGDRLRDPVLQNAIRGRFSSHASVRLLVTAELPTSCSLAEVEHWRPARLDSVENTSVPTQGQLLTARQWLRSSST